MTFSVAEYAASVRDLPSIQLPQNASVSDRSVNAARLRTENTRGNFVLAPVHEQVHQERDVVVLQASVVLDRGISTALVIAKARRRAVSCDERASEHLCGGPQAGTGSPSELHLLVFQAVLAVLIVNARKPQ